MNSPESLHLWAGWSGVTLGVVTGALLGWFFHKDDWLGGYNSWSRRMLRLGHISFFGLAFLNFMFALTVRDLHVAGYTVMAASLYSSGVPLRCRSFVFYPRGKRSGGISFPFRCCRLQAPWFASSLRGHESLV